MKPIKAGVIGVGFIGAAHIEALRRLGNIEIIALTDELDAAAKAKTLNIPQSYSDYREMIDTAGLDVIHICTPNHTHYKIAKYAMDHNLHVICEKPFTTTIEEARELVTLAKTKGLINAVNFHNRFYPMTHHLRQMVMAGELGEIFSVHGGYLQDWLLFDTDFNWRLLADQGGKTRAIADIGSHWLDLVEFITGLKISAVYAEFKIVHPIRKCSLHPLETFAASPQSATTYQKVSMNTEDFASLMLKFDNGALGNALISQVFAGKKNKITLFIGGTRQSAEWDSEDLNSLLIGHRTQPNQLLTKDPALLAPASSALVSYPAGHVEGFPDTFKQAFKQIYQTLSDPGLTTDFATFEDGLREMMICESIYESAHTGAWIKIST